MKKLLLILILGSLVISASAKLTKKPTFRPDWTYEAPESHSTSFLYVVEHGEGNTQREALNQAIGRVFQSTANRIGQFVSTDEINRAVQAGTDYEVISRKMKVPINKVCEFSMQNPYDGTWTMYILCQVAVAGNVTPEFKPYNGCTNHERFDELEAIWNKQVQDSINTANKVVHKSNTRAIVASTFIPGLGQMLKGQGGSGAAFLLSEVVLFGGGTTCYFLGQNQAKIMKEKGTTYEQYTNAKKMKNVYDIAMYTAFGIGAAVHIGNMVHAWVVKDKKLAQNIAFAPAIIPTNEYSTPSYAMGAGIQIKF